MTDNAPNSDPPLCTAQGILPEGVHVFTLEQVQQRFGSFQHSDRRMRLFQKLQRYVWELRQTGWKVSLILNGSFVMTCVDEPQDIDLILVLPGDVDLNVEFRPSEYNVISRRMVRRRYEFDAFAVPQGTDEERRWIEFFQKVNVKWSEPPYNLAVGARKGLVRIDL